MSEMAMERMQPKELVKPWLILDIYKEKQHELYGSQTPLIMAHTDIDNTFRTVNKDKGIDKTEQTLLLGKFANEAGIPIHAITGRTFGSVLEQIKNGELPYFAAISSNVGTERWLLQQNEDKSLSYILDKGYQKQMQAHNYQRDDVVSKLKIELTQGALKSALAVFQPGAENFKDQQFKVSLNFFKNSLETIQVIQHQLAQIFPDKRIVICVAEEKTKKYNLDILPVTKAEAVDNASKLFGSTVNIVAGDSGNDIDMVAETGDLAFVVGGAKEELIDTIMSIVEPKKENSKSIFRKQKMKDGRIKLYALDLKRNKEGQQRIGPESLIYALRVLTRTAQIYKDKFQNIPPKLAKNFSSETYF